MADQKFITFIESAYGSYDELVDVVENWVAANKTTADIKDGVYGVLQDLRDGKLRNARTITLWYKGDANPTTLPSPTHCNHSNAKETVIDPTCTKAGSITRICQTCFKTVEWKNIPAKGHTPVTEVVQEPTTGEVGFEETTCSTCGHLIRRIPIPKLEA